MSPRNALLFLTLALTAGCPKPPPEPPKPLEVKGPSPEEFEREALKPKVAALSLEAEALVRDQDELVWKTWTTGQKVDIEQTYAGHEKLFTPENIKLIGRLRELTRDRKEQRALSHLHTHFTGEYLAKELSDVTDALANLEASVTYNFEGKDLPYRDLDRALANEANRDRRHAMYAAATSAVKRLSESVRRKDERIEKLLVTLGYPSYAAYGAELREAELDEVGALAEHILAITDAAWRQVLSQLVERELKIPLADVTRADLPRLFRARSYDASFPKAQLVPRLEQTLSGMGVPLSKLENVKLDAADTKGKNPRALTLPVVVPTDIRVSLKPAPGVRPAALALHEMGHALYYAHSQAKRFEVAKLGDATVAEAFGFLFEDLLEDSVWLEQLPQLTGDAASTYLYDVSTARLFHLRRAAAKVQYELALHGPTPADPATVYSEIMARAYQLPIAGDDLQRAGTDREDFFQSADHLRAWILAGQLQAQLKGQFGPSWWNDPQSGNWLKTAWAKGSTSAPDEFPKALGDDGFKPDVLLLRLTTALKAPLSMPTKQPEPLSTDGGTP